MPNDFIGYRMHNDSHADSAAHEGYLPVEAAYVYYRQIGQGPPLLILHGGPDFDCNYLLPELDGLSDAFHLVYYDQRGRGRSSGTVQPATVSIQSEVEDIETIRKHFGW